MGNCLAVQEQVVRVMTVDGKVLEYRSPLRVYEVLSEFTDHAVSDTFPVSGYMQANAELVGGRVYHLVPLQIQSPEPRKKKVRFSIPEVEREASTSLRVKLVISKQKLKEIIETGVVSIDGMVSKMQKEETKNIKFYHNDDCHRNMVWRPALNSITEAD